MISAYTKLIILIGANVRAVMLPVILIKMPIVRIWFGDGVEILGSCGPLVVNVAVVIVLKTTQQIIIKNKFQKSAPSHGI